MIINVKDKDSVSKIRFIKLLIDYSANIGLYNAKKALNNMLDNNIPITIELNNDIDEFEFINRLTECGSFKITNSAYIRNLKILDLGLSDKREYISVIMDYCKNNPYFYEEIINAIDKDVLINLVRKIKKEIDE